MRALLSPPHSLGQDLSRGLPSISFRLAQAFLGMVLLTTATAGTLAAQNASPTPSPTPTAQQPSTDASQQKPDRVTTTVVVHGEVKDDYLSDAATAGSLDNTPIRETPLSVTAVTSAVMSDQVSRVLSDVVKNDASVGEDYAPVGYYGDFEIRGFPIDLATGLQINGMTIAGEQDVPLENKQRVEIVKGIAGLESGIASAGGVIDYVTKEPYAGERPDLDLATDHRGSSYGSMQFAVPGLHGGIGLLITAAGEDIHTYVEGANGWRGMGAADGRWKLGANTQLTTDFEYQHKVERSEAGYQLLGGTTVPAPVYPSVMLGFQPWSKPNTFDVFNAGARLERKLAANWNLRFGGSYSHSLIDDNVIYPYGAALDNAGRATPSGRTRPTIFSVPTAATKSTTIAAPANYASMPWARHWCWVTSQQARSATMWSAAVLSFIARSTCRPPSSITRSVSRTSISPIFSYAPENPYQQAGPATLADFNHQGSGIVQERAHLPGHIVLQAGGRFARVSDFNYSAARSLWLPQYGATYSPVRDLTLYGNYGALLSLGPQAPWWVDNSSVFLTPFMTRQSEIGAKYERTILLTVDVFRMRQPYLLSQVDRRA